MKMNMDSELTKPLVEQDVEDQQPVKPQPVKPAPYTRRAKCSVPCWCKCILITLGVFFLLGAIATMVVYSLMSDAVQHFTVTTPHAPYPIVDMTEKELNVVKARVGLFVDQLLAGTAETPLTITQDEINGFIGHSDYLRGNALVTLKEGAIEEEYSLSTDMLPGGEGRYFVANDYVTVQGDELELKMETAATHHDWFDGPLVFARLQYLVSDQDMLELYLTKGSVFGHEAPQDFIDEHQNLLEDFYKNVDPDTEDVKTVLENIERVTIHEGKIVVEPRKKTVTRTATAVKLSFPNVPAAP